MPKYEVQIQETIVHTVKVWAEDTDIAIQKAYDIVMNDPNHPDHFEESGGTNPDSAWVEELEGDD